MSGVGSRLVARLAAAMLVVPARRWLVVTMLGMAAGTAGGVAGADPVGVFAVGDVAYPVDAVLD